MTSMILIKLPLSLFKGMYTHKIHTPYVKKGTDFARRVEFNRDVIKSTKVVDYPPPPSPSGLNRVKLHRSVLDITVSGAQ